MCFENKNNFPSLRTSAGLTQQQLADKACINIRMVQHLERGDRLIENTTLKTAIALADALKIKDLRELL